MGLLRYLLNHPQILIILIFVVGPVLRSIFERLRQQAQARQAEIARERAKIEALRTGGRVEEDAPPAGVTLERRAATRQGPAVRTQPRPTLSGGLPEGVADQPEAGRPAKRRRDAERRGPRVPGRTASDSPQQPPADRAPSRRPASIESIDVEVRPRPVAPREQPPAGPSMLQRDAAARDEAALAAAGVALAASARSKAAWRRAIVMQELLMPPVSMR